MVVTNIALKFKDMIVCFSLSFEDFKININRVIIFYKFLYKNSQKRNEILQYPPLLHGNNKVSPVDYCELKVQ